MPEVLESEEEFGENSATYTRRHKYLTKKLQHFWKRWQWEYLTTLRESHENKTAGKGRSPMEGDVVVVHEDGVKRGLWKMGVVEGLICGRDKEVRGAHLRVITNGRDVHITRPVHQVKFMLGRMQVRDKTEIKCNQQICKGAVGLAEWLLWMRLKG